ncbi:MAG TPA: hypothetical protein VK550_36170 [Polyangiaceae bacterium]|nr:hypothetical protein [Polyangiaceae bacterium]
MTRYVSAALLASLISACAGSRKGADAGGGPSTGGGPAAASAAGTPGAPLATTGNASAPTAIGTPAADTTGAASASQGTQGQTCEDGKCARGLECISYYGFAGTAGPKFTACEIRCQMSGKPACPSGQSCVTISDGPGSVCRPPGM